MSTRSSTTRPDPGVIETPERLRPRNVVNQVSQHSASAASEMSSCSLPLLKKWTCAVAVPPRTPLTGSSGVRN
ncbi:MAG: hypothetical protein ABEI97_01220, partial [Candidatus Nanohaloarchaea archaeon]